MVVHFQSLLHTVGWSECGVTKDGTFGPQVISKANTPIKVPKPCHLLGSSSSPLVPNISMYSLSWMVAIFPS
jgi:hypothetical protein